MIMDHIEQEGVKFPRLADFFKDKPSLVFGALIFAGILLLSLGAGLFLFKGQKEASDIKIIEATASVGTIVVHVDGEVERPGVYQLKSDARVNDAISAAGGLTFSAAGEKVNLAAKLTDGQKIHIPSVNDAGSSGTGSQVSGVNDPVSSDQSGVVSINTASETELDKLPGIGPVTAQKIIDARPYSDISELVTKKAVGKSTFEKIKGMIGL